MGYCAINCLEQRYPKKKTWLHRPSLWYPPFNLNYLNSPLSSRPMVAPSTPTSRRSCRLLQVKSSSSVSAYVARDLPENVARAFENVLRADWSWKIHVPETFGWSISWGGSVEFTTYITLSTQDMELAVSSVGLVLQPSTDSSQVWWWFVATDSLSEPRRNQRSNDV